MMQISTALYKVIVANKDCKLAILHWLYGSCSALQKQGKNILLTVFKDMRVANFPIDIVAFALIPDCSSICKVQIKLTNSPFKVFSFNFGAITTAAFNVCSLIIEWESLNPDA